MVATLAATLLFASAPAAGKGAASSGLILARTAQASALTSTVDQPTPFRWLRSPLAPLDGAHPTQHVRSLAQATLPLDLESFSGTVCLKGAWTLRAARIDEVGEAGRPRWQMEISPAVVADGARYLPGIGAITRF